MNALASSVARQLALCATALGGLAAAAPPAQATIVTFHVPVAVPDTLAGVYIDFLTGASATSASMLPGWDFNPWGSSNGLAFFWPGTPAGTSGGLAATPDGPYVELPPYLYVGPQSTFSTTPFASQAMAFQTPGDHLLGFRFFNESTSAINYGYLSLTSGGPSGFPAVINGWSFENSGGALAMVPEVSSMALMSVGVLALGAVSLRRIRRDAASGGAALPRHA